MDFFRTQCITIGKSAYNIYCVRIFQCTYIRYLQRPTGRRCTAFCSYSIWNDYLQDNQSGNNPLACPASKPAYAHLLQCMLKHAIKNKNYILKQSAFGCTFFEQWQRLCRVLYEPGVSQLENAHTVHKHIQTHLRNRHTQTHAHNIEFDHDFCNIMYFSTPLNGDGECHQNSICAVFV